MAIQTESAVVRAQTGLSTGVVRKEADAFLNVSVVDKAGVAHSLGGGIALYFDKALHAAVIAKFEAEGELNIVASVNVIDKNKTFDL